jgi:hypothetical protein
MLSHFSWLQYGVFTGVSLVIYYAVVGLRYYRNEAKALLRKEPKPQAAREENVADDDLTGGIAAERGMSSGSLEDLQFSKTELLQGELPDCMQEVNGIIFQAAEDELSKEELLSLLKPLVPRYPRLLSSDLKELFYAHVAQECNESLLYEVSEAEIKSFFEKPLGAKGFLAGGTAVLLLLLLNMQAQAQDGNNGISEATNKVKGYFDTGCNLMYAIGAVIGLVGAVKVFSKWNAGEPDTGKVATSWFGSCIFLVVVATVLKSFFGI